MKSPGRRPPLVPRNNRGTVMPFRKSSFTLKNEIELRRRLRIQQAREQANEAARIVRQRTERAKIKLFQSIGNEELKKYREAKMKELIMLETEYQNALRDIGLGHEGVAEQIKFEKWKQEQARIQKDVAEIRGQHALKSVMHREAIKTKLQEEKNNLRKSIKIAEAARAAKLRESSRKTKIQAGDPDFHLNGKVVEVDCETEKHVRFEDGTSSQAKVVVKPFGKLAGKPGVEEAIRHETEEKSRLLRMRQTARMRGIAAIKRAQMMRRQETLTQSYFQDSSSSLSENGPSGQDEFDQVIPTKETEESSEDSSLHANVIRLDPCDAEPDDRVDHSRVEMTTKGFVLGEAQAVSKPRASRESRNTKPKADDDFIAKVLHGFEMEAVENNLGVSLQVEEVSTLNSPSTLSPSTTTSTSTSTASSLCSSSIQALITEMRQQTKPANQSHHLRDYIEQLLNMKREEIDNLSITETSSSNFSSSALASSTPTSILTSTSGSSSSGKSSLPKSVRFVDDTLDASFIPSTKQKQRHEILEETKVSLEQIQAYYEAQRQQIEAELEKRRHRRSNEDKENRSPLSEGPLSTSSTSSHSAGGHSSFSDLATCKPTRPKAMAKSLTSVANRRQVILNKSSSSGTTTSGSVATAELLQRLKRLEMPSLQRPPQKVEDVNTSADIMKASELESESPILSSTSCTSSS